MQVPSISNKDKLLKGAVACLQARGYAHTSSRDIAQAASANLASINYHFNSKDNLLEEALISCFHDWTHRLEDAFGTASINTPDDLLRSILERTIGAFNESVNQINSCVEAFAPALRSERIKSALAQGYNDVRDRAEQLVVQPSVSLTEAERLRLQSVITLVVVIIDGYMLQWVADPNGVPSVPDITQAIKTLASICK